MEGYIWRWRNIERYMEMGKFTECRCGEGGRGKRTRSHFYVCRAELSVEVEVSRKSCCINSGSRPEVPRPLDNLRSTE